MYETMMIILAVGSGGFGLGLLAVGAVLLREKFGKRDDAAGPSHG